MSKRAEERASIAAYGWQSDNEGNMTLEMFPEPFRRGFVKGYEQAEKDMIHIVKTWLSEIHRVCDITDENGYRIELRNLIASFEKTLKEE